jgi:nucleoid-associated protein YgaU
VPRPGLVVKFSRIGGVTGKGVLRQPLILPAVTDDFAFTEEAAFEDYDTVTGGEYSQPAAWRGATRRRLRRLDITFLTVDFDPPWVQSRRDQATIRDAAFGMLRGRTPVRMEANVYPDPGYTELEMNVTIRSITRTLRPGLAQARYFDLAVTEWRDNAIQRRSSTASRRRGTVSLPTTHTLAAGDTLMGLSERYYGFFGGWRQIAQENGLGHWGPNTPLQQIGGSRVGRTKLRIPEKPDLVSENQISGGRSGARPQYSGGDG